MKNKYNIGISCINLYSNDFIINNLTVSKYKNISNNYVKYSFREYELVKERKEKQIHH